MKKLSCLILPLFLFIVSCSTQGIKPLTNRNLTREPFIQPRPLITNVIEKEIIFVNPSKEIIVKTDVSYTNTFGEPIKIPLEITLKQDPTTNSFIIKNNKYIKDNSFYSSGSFLLIYYGGIGCLFGIGYLIWKYFKKRKKSCKLPISSVK